MKHSPAHYEPFLDRPVAEHCGTHIEPYGVEIDHVGLMALIDCLILPAGLAVEIIYLDRSAGDDVNVHRFEKLDGDGVLTPPDAPVLRLLYRPYVYPLDACSLLTHLVATMISCTRWRTCLHLRPSTGRRRSLSRWPFSRLCRDRNSWPPPPPGHTFFQTWATTCNHRPIVRATFVSRCCRSPNSSPPSFSHCLSRRQPSKTRPLIRATFRARTFSPRYTNRPRRRDTRGTTGARTRYERLGCTRREDLRGSKSK